MDHYGTVITAEALLRDWWAGYQQHRTVSLQHNIPDLRGIPGAPMIGLATSVDFTPQLEVEVRVLHQPTLELVRSGQISSGSLEFYPAAIEHRDYQGERAEIYHRLSPEPEHCGLSLVDIPGVPGADVLSLRALPALWAYAVVDPAVVNGTITDPEQVRQLAWLPHHNERSHEIDPAQLERALADLEAGSLAVPEFATLSREQVIQRARAHLERHTNLGLGTRAAGSPKEGENMNQWIRARAQQYQAEGLTEAEAQAKASTDFKALTPEVRARVEGTGTPAAAETGTEPDESEQEERGLLARLFGRANVTINTSNGDPAQPVQTRAAAELPAAPATGPTAPATEPVVSRRDNWLHARAALLQAESDLTEAEAVQAATAELDDQPDLRARLEQPDTVSSDPELDLRIQQRLAHLARQPEHPMAAIAAGMISTRGSRLEGDELLSEVLSRTVLKQIRQQPVTPKDRQEVDNILRRNGISARALTIEGNGTVIFEELARQFVVKPSDLVVFRNHFRTLPITGTKKVDFPRFDRSGLGFAWNRPQQGGSTSAIAATDATLDTFPLEVTELNGATIVADSFMHFNASGPAFVSQYLLPEFRGAAQAAEDLAFWLSDGSHPNPDTFKGFRYMTGITDANPAPMVGVVFTEDVLNQMLRAMPAKFRQNPVRLAFYLPLPLGDDFAEIRAGRATALGDRYSESQATVPGPQSLGRYRSIDVFGIPQLPTDETVGGDANTGTAYLVHRDMVSIGDGLQLRIETHRQPGFVNRIELQEFVGLGYEWEESLVRFSGIKPKAA